VLLFTTVNRMRHVCQHQISVTPNYFLQPYFICLGMHTQGRLEFQSRNTQEQLNRRWERQSGLFEFPLPPGMPEKSLATMSPF